MARIHGCILIALVVLTESIEGICHNHKPTTMANEFLISKWRTWYKSLDVNHDGKVSAKDAQECVNNFSELEHFNTEKEKDIATWWDECVFRERKGDISEKDFVNTLNTDFNADKEEFKKDMDRCFDLIFSASDLNEDKALSKEEYLSGVLQAFGHQQAANDKDYFSAYNPKNGVVPLCVVVETWVDFVTSTDESKGNIVRSWFKVDGFE